MPNPRLSETNKSDDKLDVAVVKLTKLQLLLEAVEYYYRGLGSSLYKTVLQAALMYM